MISIILNWSLYQQWRKRRAGKEPVVDFTRGPGYYLPLGLLFVNFRKRTEEWDMKSGKKMRVKLIDYEKYSDPDDMVKSSTWEALGYVGEKLFAEMTWKEYLIFYKNQKT